MVSNKQIRLLQVIYGTLKAHKKLIHARVIRTKDLRACHTPASKDLQFAEMLHNALQFVVIDIII